MARQVQSLFDALAAQNPLRARPLILPISNLALRSLVIFSLGYGDYIRFHFDPFLVSLSSLSEPNQAFLVGFLGHNSPPKLHTRTNPNSSDHRHSPESVKKLIRSKP